MSRKPIPAISILHGDDPSTGVYIFRESNGVLEVQANDKDLFESEFMLVLDAVIEDLIQCRDEIKATIGIFNKGEE